jgi:hypothetical protein
MLELKPIESPKAVAQLAKTKFSEDILAFDLDPTNPACPNRQHHTYGALMHPGGSNELTAPACIKHETRLCKKQAVARLRLSGLPIQANLNHSTPYEERICIRCGGGVDNEHHFLLDCTHAGLAAIRAQHPELCFTAGVKEFMAAAYDQELTESFVECVYSMAQIIES